MIHRGVRNRRPVKGHFFKGILVVMALSTLAGSTGWAGRAEVRGSRGGTEDLLSTSIMPAPRQSGLSDGGVDLPVLYERGLTPLFPAWPAVNRRALFSSPEHLPTVNGVIDLRRPLPGGLGVDLGRTFGDRGATLLVVTDGLSGERVGQALRNGGGHLVAPFGPNAWIIQANEVHVLSGLARHPGVLSVLPFGPELIVDRRIGQIPVFSKEESQRSDLPLRAGVLPGADPQAVAADLSAFGASVTGIQKSPSAFPVIRFRMPYDLILTAAEQVPGLFRIEEDTAVMVAGEEMAASMQSGGFLNGRVPLWDAGVDGGGGSFSTPQIVAVTDTGLSYDATHFADTIATAGIPGPLHSKLESYLAVGGGDLLSCDSPANGGSTHGNIVAGVMAGNVTRFGIDLRNNPGWESAFTEFAADGVARGARMVFQDAQNAAACTSDFDLVTPGNLFDRLTEARALGARVHNLSFSESGSEGVYSLESMNVDAFLRSNHEYLAVVAAGNSGSDADGDGNYEFGSITAPGTAKNALTVGASNFPNEPINPFDPVLSLTPGVPNEGINLLAVFATGSTGRGPAKFPNRVKPDVMAPGQDIFPNLRVDGAAACASSDNDNDEATGGIECILDDDNDGTSFAAAGVAGAAALVRDYFAQGFGDDGGPGGPEVGLSVSGAAVKAVLLGSAEMMEVSPAFRLDLVQPRFDIPDLRGRFNFEQGYGRVNLSKILPLNTSVETPRGLFLEDQGINGGLLQGETYSRTFTVLNPDEELRISLAWMDVPDLSGNGSLLNDLDLRVIDHGSDNILGTSDDVLYHGNFFTEDQGNFDGRLQLFDPNFPGIEGEDSDGDGVLDESAFSLPVDVSLRDYRDDQNPNEVVMLSPDPNRDGDDLDRQVFPGRQYTVKVLARRILAPFETIITAGSNLSLDSTPGGDDQISGDTIDAGPDGVAQTTAAGDDVQVVNVGESSPQRFALVVSGGIVNTASVRLNASRFVCNALVTPEILDPSGGLLASDVSLALSIQVLDPALGILDTESVVSFSQPDAGNGRFVGEPLAAIDGLTPVANDGVLSVVDGATIIVTYSDADGPVVDFRAQVSCEPNLDVATISVPGANQNYRVQGGCDPPLRRDPRGFLVGSDQNPVGDMFLDAGERLSYSVAILNQELSQDLIDAVGTLRAVLPDGDNATDPARLNNPSADNLVTIYNPQRDVGLIPRGSLQSVSFDIRVSDNATFPNQIEMVFGLSARRNGLPVQSTIVFLHTLNMDMESFRYSSDFPTGGSETRVYAGELFDVLNPQLAAETFIFADASDTSFGGGNPQWDVGAAEPKAPWTFDLDNENFLSRRRFDSNPGLNLQLNLNLWHWMNTGECGFQSNDVTQTDGDYSSPQHFVSGTGGIWHTGTIGVDPPEPARKAVNGRTGFDLGCEDYDIPNDASTPINEQVLDVLSSPVFHRVHQVPDANGFNYTLQFSRLAFNTQIDIADANVILGWELDPDTTTVDPVDALDFAWLNIVNSARGFLTGVSQIPYATFDPNNPHEPGTEFNVGPHGPGGLGSYYDPDDPNKAPDRALGAVGGTGFGTIQLRGAGGLPLRNVEEILDGFYGGNTAFEDIFGPNENELAVPPIRRDDFQVNFGIFVKENANPSIQTLPSYGMGIDDVVVEWVESHPVADTSPCVSLDPGNPLALGSCARILWDRSVVYEAEDSAVLSILDPDAAFGSDQIAGTGDEQAVDSDGDGFLELTARVFSDVDIAGETITLVQTEFLSPLYTATVQLSASVGANSATDGIVFMQQNGDGTVPVVITAQFNDLDDGSGSACGDNPLKATMQTQFVGGNVLFVSARVEDLNGDLDDLPDAGETIRLNITVVSNMIDSADNPVILENTRIFLTSTDPDIACITDNVANYGDLIPGEAASNPPGDIFEFVVGEGVDRVSLSQIIRGTFSLGISGSFVDVNGVRRTISSFATPQIFELNLDLDLTGTTISAPDFVENWDSVSEGGDGINSFTSGPLFPVNDALTVDGSRCQFNDPDGPNSNGGGRSLAFCLPWQGSDWHQESALVAPSLKTFSGDGSLHMGTHEIDKDFSFDTYSTGQLSESLSPILNIGLSGGSFVEFRHIVAMADDRTFNVPSGEAADRGVVQVAQVDSVSGVVVSAWQTIPAFQNNYANQGTGAFINCKFDPVDDFYDTFTSIPNADPGLLINSDGVSTEDDYFDPNDPERRLGPSSTCFPEFVFAFMGDWTSTKPINSGRAFVKGETGAQGNGIWVKSIFSLDKFAGQSIRVRLLFSGLELNGPTGNRWAQFFGNQLGNGVRGWMVDDFVVKGLITAPAELLPDSKTPPSSSCPVDPDPSTPANEAACGIATAVAGLDFVSPAPGFLVTLDGSASSLDACVNGFIEYRFASDSQILQDWSSDFIYRDNPVFSTSYHMSVRCSVDPMCADTTMVHVSVAGLLREVGQGGPDGILTVSQLPAVIVEGAGGNGLADTTADPLSDDVQVVAVGGVVAAGATVVAAGPDSVLQTLPAGDDVIQQDTLTAILDWQPTEAGLSYDIQQVDIEFVAPLSLREDPGATPQSTLPISRICRLAQVGDGVGTYTESVLDLQPGQIVGYLLNSRRLSDSVPGNLGAGLALGGTRRPRPVPPATSCP